MNHKVITGRRKRDDDGFGFIANERCYVYIELIILINLNLNNVIHILNLGKDSFDFKKLE